MRFGVSREELSERWGERISTTAVICGKNVPLLWTGVLYTWGNSHKIYIISIPPKSDMYVFFIISLGEAKTLFCVDYSIPITRVGGIQLNFFPWLFLKKSSVTDFLHLLFPPQSMKGLQALFMRGWA
jgi:hypothetical protein